MMRKLSLTIGIIMFLSMTLPAGTVGDDRQPSPGNNVLYFHSTSNDQNHDHPMNAKQPDENFSGNSVFARWVGNGPVQETFTENPVLDHNLKFTSNGSVVIEVHMEKAGFISSSSSFQLKAGQNVIGQGSDDDSDGNNIYHVEFQPNVQEINASENLQVSVGNSFTGEGEYTIYTDGSSWVSLPLENATNNTGNNSNTHSSSSSSSPGFESALFIGAIGTAAVAAVVRKRRRD